MIENAAVVGLVEQFAENQGKHVVFHEEIVPEDEGHYVLIYDPRGDVYQVRQVRQYLEDTNPSGEVRGVIYGYPFGRRSYTEQEMILLFTVLTTSMTTPAAEPQPPRQHFQDQPVPPRNTQDDPWFTPTQTLSRNWFGIPKRQTEVDATIPFRFVVELGIESSGTSEACAAQRLMNALNELIDHTFPAFDQRPDFAVDGANRIMARIRRITNWPDHPDYR